MIILFNNENLRQMKRAMAMHVKIKYNIIGRWVGTNIIIYYTFNTKVTDLSLQ